MAVGDAVWSSDPAVVPRASVRQHRRAHDVLLEKSAAFDVQRKRPFDLLNPNCPIADDPAFSFDCLVFAADLNPALGQLLD
jgi:hypothetical protein